MKSLSYFEIFRNRRLFAMLLLGFASGLPLALSGTTLRAWATDHQFSLKEIGLLGLATQAYVFKFLWAPLIDRFTLLPLGRRRSWLLIMQILLCFAICMQAIFSENIFNTNNTNWLWSMALTGSLIALFSATLDMTTDALRADCLPEEEKNLGASLSVMGYRIAMLVSGGFVIIGAVGWANNDILGSLFGTVWSGFGWRAMLFFLAFMMGLGIIGTLIIQEPIINKEMPPSFLDAAREALGDFFKRPAAISIILFIVLYKLGDAFASTLVLPFITNYLKFTLADYSIISKFVGGASTIIGMYLGKKFIDKLGLYKMLWLGAILQAISNLGYYWLAISTKSYISLAVALGIENICGGIGTMASVVLLMRLTDIRYSATQLALFSAAAGLTSTYVGSSTGFIQPHMGWDGFFLLSIIISIPCLFVLHKIRHPVQKLEP